MRVIFLLSIPFLAAVSNATSAYNYQSICQIISPKYRADYIGKTITIRGTYSADLERAVLVPDRCEGGVGVGDISPSAEKFLAHDPTEIISTMHASFTGTLARGKPSKSQFYRDDGVRFNIDSAQKF